MKIAWFLCALTAVLAAGCGTGGSGRNPEDYVKPTIAVMKFENRAAFPLGWNLSGGMQEVLVDRLMETGRYTVVERQELDSVLKEIRFQQSGATRTEGKATTGRIKNCQYLIKGVVTDFGHVSSNSAGMTFNDLGSIFGSSNQAVMGIILYVVDVESGEVIASENISESVSASDVSVQAAYKGVAFGGSSFYRTPLGRATTRVVDRAVRRITSAIASQPWEPKVAMVQDNGSVIINGGRDRNVRVGAEFDVVEQGPPIVDPSNGDVIGYSSGRIIGRLIVDEVHDRYAVATVVEGKPSDLRIGQYCRRPTIESRPLPAEDRMPEAPLAGPSAKAVRG
jgi:curli biogenesis system outer membrane secretion channel CsgG